MSIKAFEINLSAKDIRKVNFNSQLKDLLGFLKMFFHIVF